MSMTIEQLQHSPLWDMLPATIKRTVQKAQDEGWELHGKGASIAFRFDRQQDELDMPFYLSWQIGTSPTGKISYTNGKGGTPNSPLSPKEAIDYMEDPTVVYPVDALDVPWDTSEDEAGTCQPLGVRELTEALGAVEITPSSPASQPSSATMAPKSTGPALRVGTQSAAPSTTTIRPLRVGTKS